LTCNSYTTFSCEFVRMVDFLHLFLQTSKIRNRASSNIARPSKVTYITYAKPSQQRIITLYFCFIRKHIFIIDECVAHCLSEERPSRRTGNLHSNPETNKFKSQSFHNRGFLLGLITSSELCCFAY